MTGISKLPTKSAKATLHKPPPASQVAPAPGQGSTKVDKETPQKVDTTGPSHKARHQAKAQLQGDTQDTGEAFFNAASSPATPTTPQMDGLRKDVMAKVRGGPSAASVSKSPALKPRQPAHNVAGDWGKLPVELTVPTVQRVKTAPDTTNPTAAFSDAPERRIGTIVIGNHNVTGEQSASGVAPSQSYHEELLALKDHHGFQVATGWNTESGGQWLRDGQIARNDGGFLAPRNFEAMGATPAGNLARRKLKDTFEENTRKRLPPDSYVNAKGHPDGGQVPMKVWGQRASQSVHTLKTGRVTQGSSLVEGGNLVVATNLKGETRHLVGEASVIQTALIMEKDGRITPELVKERAAALSGTPAFKDSKLKAVGETLRKTGALPPGASKPEALQGAREHLATMDLARDAVAKDLGIHPSDVVVLEQPAFHLDMALAAGPGGHILLQDHGKTTLLAKEMAKRNHLTDADKQQLAAYQENAKLLHGQLAESTTRTAKQLEAAGYGVVRIPGSLVEKTSVTPYLDGSQVTRHAEGSRPINYFNNISGTAKDGKMYYMTNGATGTLGALFNGYMDKTLRTLGFDDVHFLGVEGGRAHASLAEGGGIRCLTTVFPHQD